MKLANPDFFAKLIRGPENRRMLAVAMEFLLGSS